MVSLIVDDPAVDLFGNEPVFLGDQWAGDVRAAAYGYTVGGAVGLAQVQCPDGVTAEWLKAGGFRVAPRPGTCPPGCSPRRCTTRSACASWTSSPPQPPCPPSPRGPEPRAPGTLAQR